MVTLKYSEVSSFPFAQAMQKISSTPTHGAKASQIHRVTKQLDRLRKQISKEYQEELVNVYGKKDEEGKLIRPEGEPNGFEPDETKQEEFVKAQEEFGNKTVELDVPSFNLDVLADIKLSAQDLEALKGLYMGNYEAQEDGGPGVPKNVASIR